MNPRTLAAWLRQPVAGTRDMPDTRATRLATLASMTGFGLLMLWFVTHLDLIREWAHP